MQPMGVLRLFHSNIKEKYDKKCKNLPKNDQNPLKKYRVFRSLRGTDTERRTSAPTGTDRFRPSLDRSQLVGPYRVSNGLCRSVQVWAARCRCRGKIAKNVVQKCPNIFPPTKFKNIPKNIFCTFQGDFSFFQGRFRYSIIIFKWDDKDISFNSSFKNKKLLRPLSFHLKIMMLYRSYYHCRLVPFFVKFLQNIHEFKNSLISFLLKKTPVM